jgi:DNA-binding LacI/PurR family transcriptional regulator/signal transduction histidine kinase
MHPASRRPVLGFLIDTLLDPYQQEIWQGVIEEAARLDLDLRCYVACSRFGEGRRSMAHDLISPGSVDVLIATSSVVGYRLSAEELAGEYSRLGRIPLVSLGMEIPGAPSLVTDGGAGIAAAVDHLVRTHGRRRIAFVRGPARHDEAEERYRAYCAALERNGLPLDPDLVCPGDFDRSDGPRAVRVLLEERQVHFDALVAANDYMGMYAMRDLQRRGIRVPEDVAVTGFDDIRDASCSEPLFSTVRQPLDEMGRASVRAALALIRGEEVPPLTRYPAPFVPRSSCGCSPRNDAVNGLEQLRRYVTAVEQFEVLQRIALTVHTDHPVDVRQVLVRELPQLGISTFRIARYRDERRAEAASYLAWGALAELGGPDAETVVPAPALVPGLGTGPRRAWVILPIQAGEPSVHWGFAACALSPVEPVAYETVMIHVGTALRVSELIAREREHASLLEVQVERRTRELREAQAQLLDSARQAGMAEVAVGVLHNVGNLLNSVNVCAEEISAAARSPHVDALDRANALFAEHAADLPGFFARDERARHLPRYYAGLGAALRTDMERVRQETAELTEKTDLIRDTIRGLQEYARGHQDLLLREPTALADLVESALRIQAGNLAREGVTVHRRVAPTPPLLLPRARVVHVLVNLVKNALEAMRDTPRERRQLTVELAREEGGALVRITDSGAGIAPEHLRHIFEYGFTTKPDGHGFGLHTCANHMAQLGGAIRVESEGTGRGATFTLRFPTSGDDAA